MEKLEIAVFTKTQKDLVTFEQDFKIIPDASTADGYAFVKSACSVLTTARTKIESARKKAKQPLLDAGKKIDADAKAITERIVVLEEPMKAQKKIQDDKEAIAKAERIAKLKKEVDKIAQYVDQAKGLPSADILKVIESVKSIDTSSGYYDLTAEATQSQADTLTTLGEMYASQFSYEDQETQRIEAEEKNHQLLHDQRINDKLNNLRNMPMEFFGKSAQEIRDKIFVLEEDQPKETNFFDRTEEAVTALAQVISQLRMMLAQAEQIEAIQASSEAIKQEIKEIMDFKPEEELTFIKPVKAEPKGNEEELARLKSIAINSLKEALPDIYAWAECLTEEADKVKATTFFNALGASFLDK